MRLKYQDSGSKCYPKKGAEGKVKTQYKHHQSGDSEELRSLKRVLLKREDDREFFLRKNLRMRFCLV